MTAVLDSLTPAGVPEETERPTKRDLPRVTTWEGRYVLGDRLGTGGMSIVYEAQDLLLGRTVAIKELRSSPDLPLDVALEHEARALAAVDHPAVVSVLSVYPHAVPAFLVMERVRGRPLSSILTDGRMPVARALSIMRQIASGLDALHRAGIVHGDVKPSNVIVSDTDVVKIIDVGLAPLLARMRPGQVLGTPAYMAPERALGTQVETVLRSRGDVYSFAVLCFEMLTGRLPFIDPVTRELLAAHTARRPPMPSTCAGLSTEFDGPIARALAKSPAARHESCTSLVDELEIASAGCDPAGRRLRVLIADDDDDQLKLLQAVVGLNMPGAQVTLCSSGQSVLDAVTGREFSIAILDLNMPGPSGMPLVSAVRELAPLTAILIVTGEGSGAERASARELGVRRFVLKPFELDELASAMREAVDIRSVAMDGAPALL